MIRIPAWEARGLVWKYLKTDHHANLFLTWELHYPLEEDGAPTPENVEIVDEFVSLLEKMGIVG